MNRAHPPYDRPASRDISEPPPPWGRREVMIARLSPLLEGFELRTRTVQLTFPDADACQAVLGAPNRAAFDRLLASCNNTVDRVEIDARYLIGFGRRPC